MVTQLRLDAALYEPAPVRKTGKMERPCKKDQHLPSRRQSTVPFSLSYQVERCVGKRTNHLAKGHH